MSSTGWAAILGVFVAKHPKRAPWAIAASIVALALDALFVVYALTTVAAPVGTVLLYALLFAVIPAVYCVASVKVNASRTAEGADIGGRHSITSGKAGE